LAVGRGRPRGSSNKTTREAKDLLNKILAGRVKQVGAALDELYEKDKHKWLIIIKDLLSYTVPKKKDVTSDDKPIQSDINIIVESDEQRDKLSRIDEVINSYN